MERQAAIRAYQRVNAVSEQMNRSLLAELRRRSGDEGMTPHLLHNWHDLPQYAAKLRPVYRWFRWAEDRQSRAVNRLRDHFAKFF